MNDQLRIALHNVGKTVVGLDGGFWHLEAPQKTEYPYAVFSDFAANREKDSADKFDYYYVQINIYSDDVEVLEDLNTKFEEKFDGKKDDFTMASFWMIDIELITPGKTSKIDDEEFQLTQEYKIHIQHK